MAGSANKTIDDRWKSTTKAQTAQRSAQHQAEKANIQSQVGKTQRQYDSMKNQAVTGHRMQERTRRERMANMGLSGAGGTSRTFAQRNRNNLNNQLGSVAQQRQDYTNNVNTALSNLDRQYNADVSAISAQNNAARNAEQLAHSQWQAGHNLQQQQLRNSQNQWHAGHDLQKQQFAASQNQWKANQKLQQQQFDASRKDAVYQKAYQLYSKRLITKSQLMSLTGMT